MLSSLWNWLTDLAVALLSTILALGALCLIILIAWLVVWRLFLRHIPACREFVAMLLPQAIAPSTNTDTRTTTPKRRPLSPASTNAM